MGNPVAGNMYSILCRATLVDGIQSTPIFTWLDSNGNRIVSGNGISVGLQSTRSLPLDFSILRGSHSGNYTCTATLFSLALQTPLVDMTSITLTVLSELIAQPFIIKWWSFWCISRWSYLCKPWKPTLGTWNQCRRIFVSQLPSKWRNWGLLLPVDIWLWSRLLFEQPKHVHADYHLWWSNTCWFRPLYLFSDWHCWK